MGPRLLLWFWLRSGPAIIQLEVVAFPTTGFMSYAAGPERISARLCGREIIHVALRHLPRPNHHEWPVGGFAPESWTESARLVL